MKLTRRMFVLVLSCTAVLVTQGNARADAVVRHFDELTWNSDNLATRIAIRLREGNAQVGTASVTALDYDSIADRMSPPRSRSSSYKMKMTLAISADLGGDAQIDHEVTCEVAVNQSAETVVLSECRIPYYPTQQARFRELLRGGQFTFAELLRHPVTQPQQAVWQGTNARPLESITGPDSVDQSPRQPAASRASGT